MQDSNALVMVLIAEVSCRCWDKGGVGFQHTSDGANCSGKTGINVVWNSNALVMVLVVEVRPG